MFGRRTSGTDELLPPGADEPGQAVSGAPSGGRPSKATSNSPPVGGASSPDGQRTDAYYDLKRQLFGALIEIIDASQLTKMDVDRAREEISGVVSEIVSAKRLVMSTAEQKVLLDDICNDVLGYGPLEPLLARDDISDIMVN